MAAEQRAKRGLRDPSEDRNFEPAQHEQVDEAGGDQRLLQIRRDALADAQHDAEQHRCMGRRQHAVDGACVPGADGGGESQQAVVPAGYVDARGLQLEVGLALSEVGAPIEGGQVSRQHQLARGLHLIPVCNGQGTSPADHQVADVGHGPAVDRDHGRDHEDLGATARRAAVVIDLTADHSRVSGLDACAIGDVRIDRRQLRARDSGQRGCERDRDHGGSKGEGEGQRRQDEPQRDHSGGGKRRQRDIGGGDGGRPRDGNDGGGRMQADIKPALAHSVRYLRVITNSASLMPSTSTSSRMFWNPPKLVR